MLQLKSTISVLLTLQFDIVLFDEIFTPLSWVNVIEILEKYISYSIVFFLSFEYAESFWKTFLLAIGFKMGLSINRSVRYSFLCCVYTIINSMINSSLI